MGGDKHEGDDTQRRIDRVLGELLQMAIGEFRPLLFHRAVRDNCGEPV